MTTQRARSRAEYGRSRELLPSSIDSALRKYIMFSLFRRLLVRSMLLLVILLSFWQLLRLLELLLGFGSAFLSTSLFYLCSALSLALFWPFDSRETKRDLRRVDRDTLFEALGEMEEGPARAIATESLTALLRDPDHTRSSGRLMARGFTPRERSLMRIAIRVVLGILVSVQLAGLLVSGHFLWGYGGEAAHSATGNRETFRVEEKIGSTMASEAAKREEGTPDLDGGEKEILSRNKRRGGEDGSLFRPASGQSGRPMNRAAPRPATGLNGSKGIGLPESESTGDVEEAHGETGDSSRTDGGESGGERNRGDFPAPGTGSTSRGAGFAWTADTGIPSPLLEYRSWMERMASTRLGKTFAATGDLGAASIEDFSRQMFGSFRIPSGIRKEDDPYTALLKRRWTEEREALR